MSGIELDDPLDTVIRERGIFDATVVHYANLHGVDVGYLRDELRRDALPGAPITARLIFDAAARLRGTRRTGAADVAAYEARCRADSNVGQGRHGPYKSASWGRLGR